MHLSHSVTLCPTLSHLTRPLVQEDWLRSFLTNFTYFLKYLCPNMLKKNDWMCCCRLSAFLVRFFLDTLCTFFSDGAWHISYFNFSSFSDQGHQRHMMDMKLSLLLRPEILLTLFSFLSENLTPTNISAVSLLWLFFARYQYWYWYLYTCIALYLCWPPWLAFFINTTLTFFWSI